MKDKKNKHIFTFAEISSQLGLNSRQDSNNYWREFQDSGLDFGLFIQRKKKLGEAMPLIEKQVLYAPLLNIKDHWVEFCERYTEYDMSYICFRNYYSGIDAIKLQKSLKSLFNTNNSSINPIKMISEVLSENDCNGLKRKEIVDVFPEAMKENETDEVRSSFLRKVDAYGKNILTMFLIACGLNYKVLAMLLGVSKSSIGNYFHKISFMKEILTNSIIRWSGEISVDEKWLKINGEWCYVLSIVDNKTGFLLYYQLVTYLNADNWKLFFQRFYQLYGIPKLIVSDGSKSLAKARNDVFPKVKSQLCKFHKYKNLLGRIRKVKNGKKQKRCLRLARGIFCNKTYYGRKRAARTLEAMNVFGVSSYVTKNILKDWDKLTMNMTSNASERWNRKIAKVIAKRYGLKSEEFVNQLITALWLKESLNNRQHFDKCFLDDIDLPRICQENIKMCNIIDIMKRKLLLETA